MDAVLGCSRTALDEGTTSSILDSESCEPNVANSAERDATIKENPATSEETKRDSEGLSESAAIVVQSLFRGHRTRRTLADAAVMAHKYGWWNVLDGAMLHNQSAQFYAYNAPETAATRWMRLKKKAAKVGKGLSKDDKARKLALQHWLEAIDPRHRYGHNLHFYHDVWFNSQSQQPFFYWLDLGEGKELCLEKCSRSKLQSEQIKYLGPKERKWYEVEIDEGKLRYKLSKEHVNTPKGDRWIFVMGTTGKLYVAKKERGKLQHSSFLAGGATTAAGRLRVRDGTIELMEAHSGHYHPTPENFNRLISILTSNGADLTVAKVQFCSDDMLPDQKSKADTVEGMMVDDSVQVLSSQSEEVNIDDSVRVVNSLSLADEDVNLLDVEELTLYEKTDEKLPAGDCSSKEDIKPVEMQGYGESSAPKSSLDNLQGLHIEVLTLDQTCHSGDTSTQQISPLLHQLLTPALMALNNVGTDKTLSGPEVSFCEATASSGDV